MPTDLARLQRRHKAVLEVGPEALIVDRTVTQARRCDAIVGQGEEHRHRTPAAMWRLGSQRPTAPRHPCGRIMLVLARASSMNTRRTGLMRPWCRFDQFPRRATSGRSWNTLSLTLTHSRRRKRHSVSQVHRAGSCLTCWPPFQPAASIRSRLLWECPPVQPRSHNTVVGRCERTRACSALVTMGDVAAALLPLTRNISLKGCWHCNNAHEIAQYNASYPWSESLRRDILIKR
jgi:hypothetical protein